jgi:3-phosphoshikimate 1-carboxyvinyltransferase
MELTVHKTSRLSGMVTPPSSKSQNIRGLIFGLMTEGETVLANTLDADDTHDAIQVCHALGAAIIQRNSEIIIESAGLPLPTTANAIYSGNSGITTRFSLPLLGYRQNPTPIEFNCGEQMRARPIRTLVEALRNLGMQIEYLEQPGACPLRVSGRLTGGKTGIDGLSSQYLSALLMALPCAEQDSEVTVLDLHERPYVEMTLQWLREQNIHYQHQHSGNSDVFKITGRQRYHAFRKNLTGDFSSASSLIVAGVLLGGTVELLGLDLQDPQGDKRLIEILQEMGANIVVEPSRLLVHGSRLTGIRIDANDIPDLLPVLAVIGAHASGKTTITNVRQARIKETDRIHSLTQGLTRMGAVVEEFPDGMTIHHSPLKGARVNGFGDHRTVMALSIAGLTADGVTIIDDAQAINKTFPTFIEQMQTLGAKMEIA